MKMYTWYKKNNYEIFFNHETDQFFHVKFISKIGNIQILGSILKRETRRKELPDKKLKRQNNKCRVLEILRNLRTFSRLDKTRRN